MVMGKVRGNEGTQLPSGHVGPDAQKIENELHLLKVKNIPSPCPHGTTVVDGGECACVLIIDRGNFNKVKHGRIGIMQFKIARLQMDCKGTVAVTLIVWVQTERFDTLEPGLDPLRWLGVKTTNLLPKTGAGDGPLVRKDFCGLFQLLR